MSRSSAWLIWNSKYSTTYQGGPERVVAIRNALAPLEIDLGAENHRSPDTEILAFANDILTASVSADAILISS